ncbi:MAG: prepilin-type N-terminal cleavage/methylation domain-containing protein [Oligosphaeraceae bacterium]
MRRRAFTMLEFGVMAIIVVILASLSLPTLTSLRRKSVQVSCQANLRELLIGAYLYVDGSRGYLVPMEYVPGEGEDEVFRGQPEAYGWFTLNPLVVEYPETWGEWQNHVGDPTMEGGRNLMRCPECTRENHSRKELCYQASPASGWSRRLFLECMGKGIPYSSSQWRKLAQLRQPDLIPGYLDGLPAEMANGFGMLPEWMLSTEVAKKEIFRHNGRVNIAFMDGHAESVPLLKALATTEHGEQYWNKEFQWIPVEE